MADIEAKMATCQIGKSQDTLYSSGIGSCMIVMFYDREKKIGCMLHAMLPVAPSGVAEAEKAKYVDTGIDVALSMLRRAGADTNRLSVKLAGGANMFPTISLASATQIGERNADAAHLKLSSLKLSIASKDIGGSRGRNIIFRVDNGGVEIKTSI